MVDKWSKNLTGNASAFAYSLFYVYFEQYSYIKGVAFQNLLLACGAVFGAVVVLFLTHIALNSFKLVLNGEQLLKNAYSALFVFVCTFLSAFDMLGLLWILNKVVGGYEVLKPCLSLALSILMLISKVQINAVSVVNFITTAGLSVEFAIHIMLKYTRYKGTRVERAKEVRTLIIGS